MPALVERLDTSFAGPRVGEMSRIVWRDVMESPGSLLLIDPTHPVLPWPSGVPASTSRVPNVLWENAVALTGGTKDDLSPIYTNEFTAPTRGKAERTSKGGLHALLSNTVSLAAGEAVVLQTPSRIKAYWKANPTHEFYLSLWQKVTRVDANTGVHVVSLISTNSVFGIGVSATGMMGGTVVNQSTVGGWNVWGNALRAGSATPGPNFATDTDTNLRSNAAAWMAGMRTSPNNPTGHGSRVLYRVYLEDLTAAGRSYADAYAIDNELYQRQVLNFSGRYYGDTHTDPTTMA